MHCYYLKPLSLFLSLNFSLKSDHIVVKSFEGEKKKNPWEDLLAVTKLASRKVLGHLKKISSLFLTSKNMVREIGDPFLLIQVFFYDELLV